MNSTRTINTLKSFPSLLHRELDIFIRFTRRDWSASFGSSLILSIGAARSLPDPLSLSTLSRYPFLLLWTALYIYFFDLLNQIIGVDEDRVNKPDRPIPSGKVTVHGAKARCIAVAIMFLCMGLYNPSVLPETVVWIVDTAFLCLTDAGQHWVGKDCIGMSAAFWSLLSASWKSIAPPTPQSQQYTWAIALWIGLVMNLQDLRDAKGDALIGRKTMPLAFGDKLARYIIAFCFIPVGFAILWAGGVAQTAPLVICAANALLGWRVLQSTQGPQYDHKTYMLWTYTLCLILGCISLNGASQSIFAMI